MLFTNHAWGLPRRPLRLLVFAGVLVHVFAAHSAHAQSAVIDIGSNIGLPGHPVDVTVSLATAGGLEVAATVNDITFYRRVMTLETTDCRVNPASGKTLSVAIVQQTRSSRTMRLFVQSIFTAPPIPEGLLYTCTFHIAPTALPGRYPLIVRTSRAFGPTGAEVPRVSGTGGSVAVTLVLVPSVTPTPSPTLTQVPTVTPSPSPTPTLDPCPADLTLDPGAGPPGSQVRFSGRCYSVHSGRRGTVYFDSTKVGTAVGDTAGNYSGTVSIPSDAAVGTHLIHVASPRDIAASSFEVTPPAAGCAGDCNSDAQVSIDDLLQAVTVAFGGAPLGSCASVDVNGDGTVSINELLGAVQLALDGCGSGAPQTSRSPAGALEGLGAGATASATAAHSEARRGR
jgi:hypothetical protein